jgi:hypothetical protein
MSRRRATRKSVETYILLASRRRCCLCFFLKSRDEERKGQIAHLNHDPSDPRFDNLVWLCLEHHDEYDGKTSQSKGFTPDEVRAYRDQLYARNDPQGKWKAQSDVQLAAPGDSSRIEPPSAYDTVRARFPDELGFTATPWRTPVWLVANQPEFFAYKAGNQCDGVCFVERIDLPDGRIVIACIQMAGNPGQSITNCVEELCFQVCERLEVPPDQLVWLEHYDFNGWAEWTMVTFAQKPPHGPFADPKWIDMTPDLWRSLWLKPRKRLRSQNSDFRSKLTKLFPL